MGKKRPPRDTDWSESDEKALAQLAPEPTGKSAAFWEGIAEKLATHTGRPQRTALAVKVRAQALALAAPPAPPAQPAARSPQPAASRPQPAAAQRPADRCAPERWWVGPPTAADRELFAKWVRLVFGGPPPAAAKPRTRARRAVPQSARRSA